MEWIAEIVAAISPMADAIGLIAAVFATLGWLNTIKLRREIAAERRRLAQPIRVVLKSATREVELPLALTRADLERPEVLGRIGMLPTKGGERFRLKALSRVREFLTQLNAIRGGTATEWVISAEEAEIDQFDLDGLK